MPTSPPRTQFVICLAGHIDHGKSALVQALTGAKVDRLPEEKRRGITIDLGFAHFESGGRRFALIDVPGHERLIHTMVAGASGVDAALLVVAADDSVMPQTREHLAVVELLGIKRGVVAITKCDLADEEQLELVELEVSELVEKSFLATAPRVRVSAHTGQGIEDLRRLLINTADVVPNREADDSRFRLPIDRAFSPQGQGAVVTGTVSKGTAGVGDTLHLLPAGQSVRIRRLQSQGKETASVTAGERAAVNLTGIKATEIRRGDELVTPHSFEPTRRFLAELRVLPDAKHGLKHRQVVRLHLGANQVTAQVLISDRSIDPGQAAFAVVRCKSPIVAEYGQPLVIRQLSPAATIGGGRVLCAPLRPTDRFNACLTVAAGLASDDPAVRLAAFADLRGEVRPSEDLTSSIGLTPQASAEALAHLTKTKAVIRTPGPAAIHVSSSRFGKLKQRLLLRLQQELERRRPASQVPLSALMAAMSHAASEPILEAALADLAAKGEINRRGERVGLPSGANLSHRQRELLARILSQFATAGCTPPTDKELAEQHQLSARELAPLLQVGIDDGHLVRLSPQMAIDAQAVDELRQRLVEHFRHHSTAKVGELREHWSITRKYAIPIFEFFDERQITVRSGDIRQAGPRLTTPLDEATT